MKITCDLLPTILRPWFWLLRLLGVHSWPASESSNHSLFENIKTGTFFIWATYLFLTATTEAILFLGSAGRLTETKTLEQLLQVVCLVYMYAMVPCCFLLPFCACRRIYEQFGAPGSLQRYTKKYLQKSSRIKFVICSSVLGFIPLGYFAFLIFAWPTRIAVVYLLAGASSILPVEPKWIMFYHVLDVSVCVVTSTAYYFQLMLATIVVYLALCFDGISKVLAEHVGGSVNGGKKELIDEIMTDHMRLVRMMQELNNNVSFPFMLSYCSEFLFVLHMVTAMQEKKYVRGFLLPSNTLQIVTTAVIFGFCAIRTAVLVYLHEKGSQVDEQLKRAIDKSSSMGLDSHYLFFQLQRVTHDPVVFNIGGVVKVTREFVATICGLLITYTVVLWESGKPSCDCESVRAMVQTQPAIGINRTLLAGEE